MEKEKRMVYYLNQAHRRILHCVIESNQEIGLHPGQPPILVSIHHMGSCSQKELSKALGVTPATVAVSLQRLEKQGMICRKVNPSNQREKIIELTQKGMKSAALAITAMRKVEEKALKGFDEAEVRTMCQLVKRLCENLGEPLLKEK